MSGPVIHPSGTCFDDALDYMTDRLQHDRRLLISGLVLVHGICTIPAGQARAGELYAHAWVEEGDTLWQGGVLDGEHLMVGYPKDEFLRLLGVVRCTRYTPLQAAQMNEETCHYGPWEPEYEALCRHGKRSGT